MWLSPSGQVAHATLDWRLRRTGIFNIFFLYKQTGLIGGKGIGIQGLSSNALHKLLFPLPPLSEQYRIVEAIETVFAQLDSILTSVS